MTIGKPCPKPQPARSSVAPVVLVLPANAYEKSTTTAKYATSGPPKPRKLRVKATATSCDSASRRVEREKRELLVKNLWLRRENQRRRLETAGMLRDCMIMRRLLSMPEGLKTFLRAHFAVEQPTANVPGGPC